MTAALILFGVSAAVAQSAVTGKIVDETGAPLIGASVTVPGTSQGVSTDVDGNFTLKTDAKEIEISYVGYVPTKKPVTGPNARLGIIQMEPDAVALQDVIVMQSVAVQRKTPVAVSTVNAEEISYKLGGQEFPEILKSTPGVYVTKDGGGFGDSKINMRGFQAANVAVMVNGVPVNDMEWGGVYWSNWAGLSDVTRSMQTQRGLGASKISSPSVGGSVNIVTNGIEAKQGGTFSFGVGNDGLYSLSFSLSTGLTKSGWALSGLGAERWGGGPAAEPLPEFTAGTGGTFGSSFEASPSSDAGAGGTVIFVTSTEFSFGIRSGIVTAGGGASLSKRIGIAIAAAINSISVPTNRRRA